MCTLRAWRRVTSSFRRVTTVHPPSFQSPKDTDKKGLERMAVRRHRMPLSIVYEFCASSKHGQRQRFRAERWQSDGPCHYVFTNIHLSPTAVTRLATRWPAVLIVAGSIPGQGYEQCWRGKHCPHTPSSAHVKRTRKCAMLFVVPPAASLMAIIVLLTINLN